MKKYSNGDEIKKYNRINDKRDTSGGGKIYESIVSNETRKRLKEVAKTKEYELKNGLYGKRDIMEIMEELENKY